MKTDLCATDNHRPGERQPYTRDESPCTSHGKRMPAWAVPIFEAGYAGYAQGMANPHRLEGGNPEEERAVWWHRGCVQAFEDEVTP